MAKSLFNQFAQIRGSRTYDDTLSMTLAELAGHAKTSGQTVDITSTTASNYSDTFEKRDVGNFLVIGGSAYEITAYNSATSVTLGSAPGDGNGQSCALHYFQNLEDDLNYIRSQLHNIIGEINWYDDPDATLSGIRDELDSLVFSYLELTDTYIGGQVSGGTYTADNMLYTSSSGVHDTDSMTFDVDTGDIRMGADGGARLIIDADTQATVYGDDNTYLSISGSGGSFYDSDTLRFTITDAGMALEDGARVNDIVTVITADDDTHLVTEGAIKDYVDTAISGSNEFIELTDTPADYTNDQYKLLRVSDSADGVIFEGELTYDGTTLTVDGNTDITGNAAVTGTLDVDGAADFDSTIDVAGAATFQNTVSIAGAADINNTLDVQNDATFESDVYVQQNLTVTGTTHGIGAADFDSTLNVDGATTLGSTLDVSGAADFYSNVNISGTFGFDDGNTVDNIVTSISEPGSDNNLVTEQAVVEWVDSVSGTLQSDIIWEIVDTPTTQIRPKVEHLQKAIYTEGNVTIGGDLTVTGTLFYADTETVQVSDNIMVINYGEVGAGVTAGEAGIQVDRGSETDYLFVFDEGTDTFRIGVSGTQESFNVADLQPVATREDNPVDTRVPWWDASNYTFRTQGDTYIAVNSGTDTITFAANNAAEAYIGTGGLKLKNSTADVNEILNTAEADSIGPASTDDQLATAKLIYDYVNTVSGAMVHNELEGLQGGNGVDQYYHLSANTFNAFSSDGSTLTITDDVDATGNMAVSGTLDVDGAVDFDSTLNVLGGATFQSTVDVGGAVDIDNTLDVQNNAIFQSDVDVQGNLSVSGTFGFDAGTTVTEIATSMDPTGDDNTLLTEKAIYDWVNTVSGSMVHNELEGLQGGAADQYYHLTANEENQISAPDAVTLSFSGDVQVGVDLTVEGNAVVSGTLDVDGAVDIDSTMDVQGATVFQSTVDIDGAVDIDSTLNVQNTATFQSDVDVQSNLSVSGTFGFDVGTTVTEIATSMDPTGDDNTLLTEKAIYDWVNTVSGSMVHNELEGLQGGNGVDEFYHLTANEEAAFTSDGATFSFTQNLDVDGNVNVSGTFGFDGGTAVDNISTAMSPTGDDVTLLTEKAIYDWVNTVSGAITSSDTFLGLEDTYVSGGSYTDGNMLYTSTSGVHDTPDMVYDSATGDIRIGGTTDPRIVTNVAEDKTTIYGDDDTYITVSGGTDGAVEYVENSVLVFDFSDTIQQIGQTSDTSMVINQTNDDITFSAAGTAEMTIDTDGLSLKSGASVNDITTVIAAPGDDDTLATEKAIVDYIDTVSGSMVHNELEGLQGGTANEYYHLTNNEYSAFSSDGSTFTFTQNLAGTNLSLSGDIDAVNADFSGNVGVSGTFGFDAGTTVNEIVTSIDTHGPGSDDQLATEKAIYDFVTTVSGVLQSDIDGQDEFIELTDTPAAYAGAANQLLRVNSTPDQVIFESELTYDGNEFNIAGDLNVEQNASFDSNVAVSGTFGFDTGTTVNNIVTEISEPGSDDNLVTEQAIVEHVDSVSGTLQTDIIWEVVDSPYQRIQPKTTHQSKVLYHPGDATIGGDLTVTGTLFYADVETVQVQDNIMELNYGEPGNGVTAGEAGISIDRGGFPDYQFLFHEPSDTFRIGVSGSQDAFNDYALQPVATREDSPVDTRVTWWDDSAKTLRTQGDTYITVNSGTDTIVFAANNTTEMTVDTDGMSLKSGASVNEILDSNDDIDGTSTDDQLATAKLIYNELASISGTVEALTFLDLTDTPSSYSSGWFLQSTTSGLQWDQYIDHNSDTDGKQGGTVNEYYHLTADEYNQISAPSSTSWGLTNNFFVQGNADFEGNVGVSGTFGFDSGTTVNEIVTSIDIHGPGSDDQLATEKAIWDFVSTVSGVLQNNLDAYEHNDLEGLQGGNGVDEFYHLTANEDAAFTSDGSTFTFTQNVDATGNLAVSGTLDVDDAADFDSTIDVAGAATFQSTVDVTGAVDIDSTLNVQSTATFQSDVDVQGNLSVSGTLEFGAGDTTVNEIVTTVTSGSTDDQLPTAGAVWDLMDLYDPHTHYDKDMTWGGGGSVWTLNDASINGSVPDHLEVYVNGLKNRNHADYYTATASGTVLTVTFAYTTYDSDWVNVTYISIDA